MITTYQVSRHTTIEQPTAVIRGEIPQSEMPTWLGQAYAEVGRYLSSVGVPPSGPPFARFKLNRTTVSVEAGFPVPAAIVAGGRVEPSSLPAGPAALVTHIGRYEDLDKAYAAVKDWLALHGYGQTGPMWEVYLTDPITTPDPAQWRTDVYVPYQPL